MKLAWKQRSFSIRVFAASCVGISAIILSCCARRVLLDERFYDARLPAWTVVDDPETIEGPSEWRVSDDGWLNQESNIWGLRGDFIGRWHGTYLIAGDAGWTDYTLSVKAKPKDDDGFGVVFRYQDPEHFYRLLLLQDGMSGGPITRLDKRDGGDFIEVWSVPRGYRAGTDTQIEVELAGALIRAAIDGRHLPEATDESYSRGKIGLFCYAQSGTAFDDVRVISR